MCWTHISITIIPRYCNDDTWLMIDTINICLHKYIHLNKNYFLGQKPFVAIWNFLFVFCFLIGAKLDPSPFCKKKQNNPCCIDVQEPQQVFGKDGTQGSSLHSAESTKFAQCRIYQNSSRIYSPILWKISKKKETNTEIWSSWTFLDYI